MTALLSALCLALPLTAAPHTDDAGKTPPGEMTVIATDDDAEVAETVTAYATKGRAKIRAFFGRPIAKPFQFHVLPSRAAFDGFFREKWKIEETQCWWVAAGISTDLVLLSPRVWSSDACEHDGEDEAEVRGIVMHELVHVFHGQSNAKLEELETIGWFIEGLATYVSGQLDEERMTSLRPAIEAGDAVPKSLERAWSGKHRYGVSGTLVQYIDRTYGREMIERLLPMTTEKQILGALELTEEELLERWRAFVLE